MTLRREIERLARVGACRIYAKALAPNDNSKNQVYLGPSLLAVNLLPARAIVGDEDNPERLKGPLDFCWVTENDTVVPAPHAQLILYPDYPEVRLSGFLRGAQRAPSNLMSSRKVGRVLLLAVRADDTVLARALAPESDAAKEFIARQAEFAEQGVLRELPLTDEKDDGFDVLTARLASIHERGWIRSWRLGSDGGRLPCEAPQCGGYTLEAEMGIRPNGRSEPDFLGWELKHFEVPNLDGTKPASKVLTLMTPEPTGGVYHSEFDEFMKQWGYADKSGREGREGRRNFGGIYRHGADFHDTTKLKLVVKGFDGTSRKVSASGCLALVDAGGTHAAEWSFAHLLEKWSRKHARAVYVPGEKTEEPDRQYRFGAIVGVGRGTDFTLLLDAVVKGAVYLDPAVKVIAAEGTQKKRNQWRVKLGNLDALYRSFEQVDVTRRPSP